MFIQYAKARAKEKADTLAYRVYMSETLRLSAQNKYITATYLDFINNKVENDTRSGDEIAADVINRLGLRFKQDGCI